MFTLLYFGGGCFLLQILQECPEQPEAFNEMEQFDEIEAVGKSLLDRLTVPVVYPDGYGKYFCNAF